MEKLYNRINWENYPSDATPLNESNLNKLDAATNAIDDRVISMDKTKLDVSTANSMVKNVTYDESTGIFTVEYLNGSKVNIDTKLEKIAVNFTYDSVTQQIVITLDDETKQYIDLSTLITEYEFSDTATIAFSVTNGKVSAVIKNGSVTADKLEPNYLANVQLAASQAASSASAASASELATKTSENNAKSSENSASVSAASALESKESAATSEENALASKNSAESSAESALASKNSASTSASEASTSSASALESKNNAAQSAQSALSSAENAQSNAQTATSKAILAESYAKGGTGTRQGEDTDNAYYYMTEAKAQSGGIPTKLSQLTNDCDFVNSMTQSLAYYYRASQLYTKEEVDGKISAIPKFGILVVNSLPTENISETTIYILKEKETGTNKCSEWIYVDNNWEKLGDIDVDLSDYVSRSGLLKSVGSSETNTMTQKAITEELSKKQPLIEQKTAFNEDFETNSSNIKMNGTASTGTSKNVARADHTHPSDTSKLSTSGNASDVYVDFTTSASYSNLVSGKKLSEIVGQIQKNIIVINANTGTWIGPYTIPSGVTSYVISDESITETSIIDVYSSNATADIMAEANPSVSKSTQTAGSMTIVFENATTAAITIEAVKVVNR